MKTSGVSIATSTPTETSVGNEVEAVAAVELTAIVVAPGDDCVDGVLLAVGFTDDEETVATFTVPICAYSPLMLNGHASSSSYQSVESGSRCC